MAGNKTTQNLAIVWFLVCASVIFILLAWAFIQLRWKAVPWSHYWRTSVNPLILVVTWPYHLYNMVVWTHRKAARMNKKRAAGVRDLELGSVTEPPPSSFDIPGYVPPSYWQGYSNYEGLDLEALRIQGAEDGFSVVFTREYVGFQPVLEVTWTRLDPTSTNAPREWMNPQASANKNGGNSSPATSGYTSEHNVVDGANATFFPPPGFDVDDRPLVTRAVPPPRPRLEERPGNWLPHHGRAQPLRRATVTYGRSGNRLEQQPVPVLPSNENVTSGTKVSYLIQPRTSPYTGEISRVDSVASSNRGRSISESSVLASRIDRVSVEAPDSLSTTVHLSDSQPKNEQTFTQMGSPEDVKEYQKKETAQRVDSLDLSVSDLDLAITIKLPEDDGDIDGSEGSSEDDIFGFGPIEPVITWREV